VALKVTLLLLAETAWQDSFPSLSEYIVPRKFLTPPLLLSFHFTGKIQLEMMELSSGERT